MGVVAREGVYAIKKDVFCLNFPILGREWLLYGQGDLSGNLRAGRT